MTYTQQGPFNNGGAPALQASVFNAFDNFNLSIDQPSSTVLNGSTSGTATLYQPLSGTFKTIMVQLNNFRNGGGSAQTIALPVAFTNSFWGWTSQCTSFSLVKASVIQTVQQITSFVGGADNGVTPETVIKQNWMFHGGPGFDTISFTASFGAVGSGIIIIAGN